MSSSNPLPRPPVAWVDPKTGQPTQAFLQYISKLDALIASGGGGGGGGSGVGTYVNASLGSGAAIPLTTGVVATITSIALTAGDWDVSATGFFIPDNSTITTEALVGVNTSAAQPTALDSVGIVPVPIIGFTGAGLAGFLFAPVPRARFNLASAGTVFLIAFAQFGGGNLRAYGQLSARRAQ